MKKPFLSTILVAAVAASAATPALAGACPPRIDFETDASGRALAAGQVIDDEWAAQGIRARFTVNPPDTGPLIIFDSADPTGGDVELGSPNQSCGGPGVGAGGEAGQPGQNCIAQGKVLIISEDGDASDPDSSDAGGTIIFDFDFPVEVQSLGFLDVAAAGSKVELFDAALSRLGSFPLANLGRNSYQTLTVGLSDVSSLVVTVNASVGLAEIAFCPDDEDADSVPDNLDVCPGTVIPESVPTRRLGVNRWALVDNDTTFDTTLPFGSGVGPGRTYTMDDTAGCSCEQIIAAQDLGRGHERFGCSAGAMKAWVRRVNPGVRKSASVASGTSPTDVFARPRGRKPKHK